MKATIIYYSHAGRTAGYAREMAMHLWKQGVSVSLLSTADYSEEKVRDADLLLLGCWTSGWFVINQHPHWRWREFAAQLPCDLQSRLVLFTTYAFRTGSMFSRMLKHLPKTLHHDKHWRMASKTGRLSEQDKELLNQLTKEKL
ncbi:MAG: flavodoxin domain-containing protein [Bacteroidales bacterium]|nr:flavodoxin domain-containing protein [Bacteroidales bacterium]